MECSVATRVCYFVAAGVPTVVRRVCYLVAAGVPTVVRRVADTRLY